MVAIATLRISPAGSKVYFPVYVKGGGLSMGDIHFSQGDGEITFCGAIEMAGYLDLRVS
jgi:formamidase